MTSFRAAATAAVLTLTIAAPALAQQSPTNRPGPQAPGPTSQDGEMSDAMVHKVGTVLRRVNTIQQTYEQRTKAADQQQMQDLNDQARKEMVKAISDQGLSVQQYQQAIQMAQADPTLRQRVITAAEQSGE